MPKEDTQFKPGVCANPGGGRKDRITQEAFRKIFDEIANTPATDLKPQQGSALNAVLTQIFLRGMKSGEHAGLAWMLDRALGKVPEVMLTAHTNEADILAQPRAALYEFVKTAA